jgi:hypothetical protein
MLELILVGKIVALGSTLAGLYFSVKQDWYKSSIALSCAAVILWLFTLV